MIPAVAARFCFVFSCCKATTRFSFWVRYGNQTCQSGRLDVTKTCYHKCANSRRNAWYLVLLLDTNSSPRTATAQTTRVERRLPPLKATHRTEGDSPLAHIKTSTAILIRGTRPLLSTGNARGIMYFEKKPRAQPEAKKRITRYQYFEK